MSAVGNFSFENIRQQYRFALEQGYRFITCKEYVDYKKNDIVNRIIVNRVDIDFSCKKAKRLAELYNELGIKATFFVRLHANEYNPFSFENYRILKYIRDTGHEIGYHSEVIDQSKIWSEDAEDCLKRDLNLLNTMLGIHIEGVASHGGMTGFNNLDFWKDRKPSDYGLLYEAYDKEPEFNLFQESFYVSDSEWTRWKCYSNGKLCQGDTRTFAEHIKDNHNLIYLLVHPDTYYDEHFYE